MLQHERPFDMDGMIFGQACAETVMSYKRYRPVHCLTEKNGVRDKNFLL